MLLKLCRNQNGQAAIFMAVFITTMMLLFAFTTNIGMLVHAKINLQNAADAAAYAGAAVQARQMTAVGYLNWEMRRALKQFLFNYFVRGNESQACFPAAGNGSGPHPLCNPFMGDPRSRYSFRFFDPRDPPPFNESPGLYIPTTCIIYSSQNNYCQKGVVRGIPELGGISGVLAFVNPIISAVQNATRIIIDKKAQDCLSRGVANKLFLFSWLMNLDPAPPPIQAQQDFLDPMPVVNSLDALGYLMRYAILRARIDNLEEALNLNLQNEGFTDATISDETIEELLSAQKGDFYYERPIQAYLSARNNLSTVSENGNFSEIRLTELLPYTSNADQNPNLTNPPILFKLDDIRGDIRVAASDFTEGGGIGERGECQQFRVQVRIPSFPFGITKDPTVLTYYAVNLKAQVRLLFSPFGLDGRVTIGAYSAAKPFGSRIGINENADPDRMLFSAGSLSEGDNLFGQNRLKRLFPNILVSGTDQNSDADGFASVGHLGYLKRAARLFGMSRAYKLAGAYTPWEVGYYTVPANFAETGRFPSNPDYTSSSDRRFQLRVPVLPVNQPGQDLSFLVNRVQAMFTTAGFLGPGQETGEELDLLKDTFLNNDKMAALSNFMQTNGLDQMHLISDPILLDDPDLAAYAQEQGQNYTIAGRQSLRKQLTAWNTTKSSTHPNSGIEGSELSAEGGRSGYSVRLLSFPALLAGGLASNDGDRTFDSPFSRISPGNEDAQKILDEIGSLRH